MKHISNEKYIIIKGVLTAIFFLCFISILNAQTTKNVTIGNQIWMTKNLNVDKFRNGDPIPQAKTNAEWIKAGNSKKPAWCYYKNDPMNGGKLGKLYNFYAVTDKRGISPKGFHIPSSNDWFTLIDFLGGDIHAIEKIKSINGWKDNHNGTNSSGFLALPAGYRNDNGLFGDPGCEICWWGGNGEFVAYINACSIQSSLIPSAETDNLIILDVAIGPSGYSVRCIRDLVLEKNSTTETKIESIDNYNSSTYSEITQTSKDVTIGKQVWMTKNLNVDKFRNGDPIPQAKTNEEWETAMKNHKPAWCYYDNDTSNGRKYGKLYNFYAISDRRGLAPKGWTIPNKEDLIELVYVDGVLVPDDQLAPRLKSESGFNENGNGTNKSGFSGLPGGSRGGNGTFDGIGDAGIWWSSSESDPNNAWFLFLYFKNRVLIPAMPKYIGMSVRCIRE